MVTIELAQKDAAELIEILESVLADMRTERLGTDNKRFHSDLLQRERFVGDIITRLGSAREP